jgi:hypothetical protein
MQESYEAFHAGKEIEATKHLTLHRFIPTSLLVSSFEFYQAYYNLETAKG